LESDMAVSSGWECVEMGSGHNDEWLYRPK
jgi:hypothetical protein